MPLPYTVRLAFQSLRKEVWINLLSVFTIGVGLFIISLAFLIVYNFDLATRKLPGKFSVNVYLDNNLTEEKIGSIIRSFKDKDAVYSVRHISKQDALEELKNMLKDSQFIFEGLDDNPLPDSLEIKLKDKALASDSVKALAKEALSIQGVSEVDYGEKFLSTIHYLKKGLNSLGVILIVILSTGIIFVCYSTVKILFYRRMDEIETYKLLGATKWFIRSPFLIEGMLIGLAGGMISLLGINAFHYFSVLKLSITIPLFKSIIFPTRLFLWLPVIGLLLGISGAGVALGRMKY